MEQHFCPICQRSEFFLRKKGAAIGLYCTHCDKWIKWVGKKEVKSYSSRGYKVYPENYTPFVAEQIPSINPFPEGTLPPNIEMVPQDNHALQGAQRNQNTYRESSPLPHTHLDDSGGIGEVFVEYPQSTNPLNKRNQPIHDVDDEPVELCRTCTTGVIDALSKSDDISFAISRGTIRITNKNKTKLLGAFSIKHCPTCGRKL